MMKIAVCMKYVPDPVSVEVNPTTGEIDERRLLYTANPADESALEIALRMRGREDQVVALCVGPGDAEVVLRGALSVGAQDTLRLWHEGWKGTSPHRTAVLLCAALRSVGLPSLILCGNRSCDRGNGTVPALLAEILDMPAATDVTEVSLGEKTVLIRRRLSRGAREQVEVELPAVLGLEPGLARLRYASLPALIAAEQATIPFLRPEDLGLRESDDLSEGFLAAEQKPRRARPRPIFAPDSSLTPYERIEQILAGGKKIRVGRLVEGTHVEAAEAVLAFLRERGYLET